MKFKKLIVKAYPLLLIFFIWFIFAAPYFISSKTPFPSSYLVNFFSPWNSYSEFAGPVKNNAMPDIITQIYPWKNLAINFWKTGQIPFWNPYSFSGTPLLANYQSAVFSPFNLIFFAMPFIDAWTVLVLIQPLLAGVFMYLLARSLERSELASLIASVSFMFCGFIVTWMAYATLGYAILFLPLSIYAIEKYFKTLKSRYLFILSLSIPLSFFGGHFQISLYFLLTVLVYLCFKLLSTKDILKTALCFFYIVFGLLISMPQILPSIEFYEQSLRSGIFQKTEAIPWQYLATFMSPDFFGNPVTRNDWFGHYAEWNGYIGVIPFLLSFYAITGKKNVQTLFLFFYGIFILFLAFNTPLLNFLVALHFPVLSTSAASRIIVIFSFSFALLSAFGFDQLLKDIKEQQLKKITIWLFSFFGIFILLWLIAQFKFFIPADKALVARQNLILPSLIFIFSAFTILSFLFAINKKKLMFLSIILILLASFDQLRFANKWMPFDSKNLLYPRLEVTEEFSKLSDKDRFLGNLEGSSIYYGLSSAEGYDALYIKRYGEFIASLDDGKLKDSARSVIYFPRNGQYTLKAINLLGIKYVIHKISDNQKVWTFPYWKYQDQFKLIYEDNKYQIFQNNLVFPRAFLVGHYDIINNNQAILDKMFNKDFSLQDKIVLENDPQIGQLNGFPGEAKIISFSPNIINIKTNAKNKSMLFLSNPYYPGWIAKVDGSNVPIYRANYAFQAVPVNEGNHNVELIYDPQSFRIGVYLALLGILGVVMLLFARILAPQASFSFLRKQKDK